MIECIHQLCDFHLKSNQNGNIQLFSVEYYYLSQSTRYIYIILPKWDNISFLSPYLHTMLSKPGQAHFMATDAFRIKLSIWITFLTPRGVYILSLVTWLLSRDGHPNAKYLAEGPDEPTPRQGNDDSVKWVLGKHSIKHGAPYLSLSVILTATSIWSDKLWHTCTRVVKLFIRYNSSTIVMVKHCS